MHPARLALYACFTLVCFASCNASETNNTSGHGASGPGGAGGTGAQGGSATVSSSSSSGSSSSTTGTGGTGGTGGASSSGTGGTGGMPCPQGVIECNGTTAQTCDGMGGYTDVLDCAANNQVCLPDYGCINCLPGTGMCNGDVALSCLGDGSGYTSETCDPVQGMTCNPQTGHCDGACGPQQLGKSYIGCEYYPTVTANIVNHNNFHFAVAVANTTNLAATVTVTQGANQITQVTVAADSVQVIQLPWQLTLKGPDAAANGSIVAFPASVKVANGAYRLRSTQPVTVYQFNPLEYTTGGNCNVQISACSYSNDASILLPVNVWTGTYRVAARHQFSVSAGFYAVTAQEDGTTVTVAAGPGGGLVKAGIAGINTSGNGSVMLNRGDVIEVVTNGPDDVNATDDVTGTLVSADKPVQVIGGHQCTYIPNNQGYCDHIEESMFPYETLANDYIITAPLITAGQPPKVEMVRIVATKPNTTLTYDPPQNGAPASIAQAGAWVEIGNTNKDFQISGSEPILVVQYMTGQQAGGNSGDPAMTIAVGKDQYRTSYLFHAPTNYQTMFVNITAPTGTVVTLDGAVVPANTFTVIGGTGFSVSRQPVSKLGNGNHSISAPSPFGISVYGYGQYTSYWYPGGANLNILHM